MPPSATAPPEGAPMTNPTHPHPHKITPGEAIPGTTTYRELRNAINGLNVAEDEFVRARQKEWDARARVGRALRACRERHSLSLRDVAKKLNVTAPYLSDVERGHRSISNDNLEMYMDLVMPIRRMTP